MLISMLHIQQSFPYKLASCFLLFSGDFKGGRQGEVSRCSNYPVDVTIVVYININKLFIL